MQVTDSCNDCKRNDLVVAAKGMTNLSGGVNINRNPTLQVAWAFESCASLITGGIKASFGAKCLAVAALRGSKCIGMHHEKINLEHPAHPDPLQMMPSDKTSSKFLGLQVRPEVISGGTCLVCG